MLLAADSSAMVVLRATLLPTVSSILFVVRHALARPSSGSTLLLVAALAIAAANFVPAHAQTSNWSLKLPDYLFEKPKSDKAKAPAKLGSPKCPECQKQWQALKDALASWYLLQFSDAEKQLNLEDNKALDEQDGTKLDQLRAQKASANAGLASIDIPAQGKVRDDAASAHIKRKTDNPDYADRNKLHDEISNLISGLEICYASECLPKPTVEIPEVPPCVDTEAQKKDLVKKLTTLETKLFEIMQDLMQKKGFESAWLEIGDPNDYYSKRGSMDPGLLQAKANYLAADRALVKAYRLKICPTDKTSKSDEAPQKETPPKETPPKEQRSMAPGPPATGSGVNYIPAPPTVIIATDGVKWCRFGLERAVATVLTPTDAVGNPIATVTPAEAATGQMMPSVAEQPEQGATRPAAPKAPFPMVSDQPPIASSTDNPPGGAPPPGASEQPRTTEQTALPRRRPPAVVDTPSGVVSDQPPATPPRPTPPTDNPPASTPEQPRMTEQSPPPIENPALPTSDSPPSETVTIDFNEKTTAEEVAENVGKARAEASAVVEIRSVTPDLPGRGEKSAQDKGFNKDPAKGRMGADGHLRVTTNEPRTYGLPTAPGAPTHYRAEIDTPEHAGFVAEATDKTVKPAELASVLPSSVKAATDTFKLAGRVYTRVGLDWPRSQNVDPAATAASISRAIGTKLATDTCRRTKPAPAFDLDLGSASAIDAALPATTITLRRATVRESKMTRRTTTGRFRHQAQ